MLLAAGHWLLAAPQASLRAQTRNLLNTRELPEAKGQRPEATK